MSLQQGIPGGLNLKVLIIDLPEATVREPIPLRAEQTWKVKDLKTELAMVGERVRERERERGREGERERGRERERQRQSRDSD